MNQQPQIPHTDKNAALDHLTRITKRWNTLKEGALLEVRGLSNEHGPVSCLFSPNELGQAAEYAVQINIQGWNTYVCVNPIKADTNGAASNDNIIAAFFCFADADDEKGSRAIKEAAVQPNFIVETGSEPWPRMHAYWELSEPCFDLETWTRTQKAIAANLNTDKAVVNPSRIMRLPGTISYPSPQKQMKGYVPELVVTLNQEVAQ